MPAAQTSFYQTTRDARKIIVVDLGFLGDSVHLLPALWAIHRNYPRAEVHTLSAPVGSEILQLAPCVRRAWSFPLGPQSPPWWRHWDIIRSLRRERFDLAYNFSGADRTLFLTALTGARWRLAHAGGRDHFWSRWLIRDWVGRREKTLPVFEQRLEVLKAAGLELTAPRWDITIPDGARQRAEALVAHGALHFSINASSPLKEWPLEHWLELAKRLLKKNPATRIVATGSASRREQDRLAAFRAGVGEPRVQVLPADLTIADLAAVLRRCGLHLGADSGVLHLAMAVGLPTVSLFRDYSDARAWQPLGSSHRVLTVPCQCVNQDSQPCLAAGRAECLARLEPAMLEELITSMTPRIT